jgi:sn-glycerol 3-phosphate transport system ATP-binding protein
MATVDIIDAYKSYGNEPVLQGITLRIEKGEFISVVGPSGCGKSTLLRLVSGLDKVSSGEILINGNCVNNLHPSKRDIAMVFQSYALYPHMTVFDNMSYALKMRKMKKETINYRVMDAAQMLRLQDYLHRYPRELSGGQRQRVAIGRAMVRAPSVFLFDEPLSNLDAKLRTEMRFEIKKLHQQLNTTCLYVTHDQTEAMTLASRLIVLNHGKIEQMGSPIEIYQEPASLFVASFMGQYPINLLEAKLDLSSQQLITTSGITFPLFSKQSSVHYTEKDNFIVGIRPEHLLLTKRRRDRTKAQASLPVKIRFIDDMGTDRLVHVQSLCGKFFFSIRVTLETSLEGEEFDLGFIIKKAHVFDKNTGLRLGGFDE